VSDSIYLDHNATTPIDPRVVEAMTRAWRDAGANPASQHAPGRQARRMLENAREGILELLGAKTGGMDADQLVFTSGGTEANNLALLGLPLAGTKPGPDEPRASVVISAIEHPSVSAAAEELRRRGHHVLVSERLESIDLGEMDIDGDVGKLHPSLVSLMLANNETGIVEPVQVVARSGRSQGALIHTDAVQAVGKIPVHFRGLGVDAMTLAPHKFHGPLGIGGLVLRYGVKLQPQLFGGFQQAGLRPSTENVALAVGFYEALRLASDELEERAGRMAGLRDALEQLLRAEFGELVIIGREAPRLPNTSCVSFPGRDRQQLVMALDLAGVACSTGSACASGSSEPSRTLLAMGLPQAIVEGAVRFSVGATTTGLEVAEAARRILKAVKDL
jgi:cysteine desulfurase